MKRNNDMNLCSVLMITYNHEKYIAQAIDSVLMQKTNFDYEIVIGEDCSTDRTREIVLEYKAKHPDKIKLLLQKKNVGMMQNFIDTLNTCTGKYIALLEGDDYWTDQYKLQKQVEILEKNDKARICYNPVNVIKNGQIVEVFPSDNLAIISFNDLIIKNTIPTCSVVFRWKPDLNFPPEYKSLPLGDWPLYLLLLYDTDEYAVKINELMANYRLHEGGIFSNSDNSDVRLKILSVYKFSLKYFPKNKNEILKQLIKLYYSIALDMKKKKQWTTSWQNIKIVYTIWPYHFISQYHIKAIIKIILPSLIHPFKCFLNYK